ncbi:MAG: substrate-binding domain-containing protein [Flavobacterium sp.]|nr:substrate-binding domain-containing protein [Flavobacterium sp.]
MRKITLAGVPEHFNYPWIQAIESGLFEAIGLDVNWTNVPEGTGKLCQLLREGSTDLAIVLTEGILKDISLGNPSVIVQKYVESPLLWGIHVAADSPYYRLADLENKTAAISRIGSGSQLMAYVNANNQGWDSQIEFEIVHTIDGAVDALSSQKADYFMWEHFMTKPLVDQGVFRRLADCPTPWPCFVIAARKDFLATHTPEVTQLLKLINSQTQGFKKQDLLAERIAERYQLQVTDTKIWLDKTTWSQENFDELELNAIQNQLLEVNILDHPLNYTDVIRSL